MKLKKQFSDFYSSIRIDSEGEDLREKRRILEEEIKDKLPHILSNHGITICKSDIRMFIQGSYKYNTTIKSDVVDMDVAVILPLDICMNNDPRKIKGYLRDAISIPSRTVSIKEPCVRASYFDAGEEWMHIDLPLYARTEDAVYLARGKEYSDYVWETADPDGLNDWLLDKINRNDQLRRIICFLKKWKNEKYKNASSDHEIPPSIGLTFLVIDKFVPCSSENGDDDLLSLQKTMRAIKNAFSVSYNFNGDVVGADIARNLPVTPYKDIFTKMRLSSSNYLLTFYKRVCEAETNLTNAVNVESEHDAATYIQKVLGEQFEVPEKRAVSASTSTKREHNFG